MIQALCDLRSGLLSNAVIVPPTRGIFISSLRGLTNGTTQTHVQPLQQGFQLPRQGHFSIHCGACCTRDIGGEVTRAWGHIWARGIRTGAELFVQR